MRKLPLLQLFLVLTMIASLCPQPAFAYYWETEPGPFGQGEDGALVVTTDTTIGTDKNYTYVSVESGVLTIEQGVTVRAVYNFTVTGGSVFVEVDVGYDVYLYAVDFELHDTAASFLVTPASAGDGASAGNLHIYTNSCTIDSGAVIQGYGTAGSNGTTGSGRTGSGSEGDPYHGSTGGTGGTGGTGPNIEICAYWFFGTGSIYSGGGSGGGGAGGGDGWGNSTSEYAEGGDGGSGGDGGWGGLIDLYYVNQSFSGTLDSYAGHGGSGGAGGAAFMPADGTEWTEGQYDSMAYGDAGYNGTTDNWCIYSDYTKVGAGGDGSDHLWYDTDDYPTEHYVGAASGGTDECGAAGASGSSHGAYATGGSGGSKGTDGSENTVGSTIWGSPITDFPEEAGEYTRTLSDSVIVASPINISRGDNRVEFWNFKSDYENSGVYQELIPENYHYLWWNQSMDVWSYGTPDWIMSAPLYSTEHDLVIVPTTNMSGWVYLENSTAYLYAISFPDLPWDEPTLEWQYLAPNGIATPAQIEGDYVYFASNTTLFCLHMDNGTQAWNITSIAPFFKAGGGRVYGYGAAQDEGNDTHLYAWNATTGAQIWNKTVTGTWLESGFLNSEPAYNSRDDCVYFVWMYDDYGGADFYYLNATDGAEIWAHSISGLGGATYASIDLAGNKAYFVRELSRSVYVHTLAGGDYLTFTIATPGGHTTTFSSMGGVSVHDDLVYIKALWDIQLYVHCYNISTGSAVEVWAVPISNVSAKPSFSPGLLAGQDLEWYATTNGTHVLVLNSSTGDIDWAIELTDVVYPYYTGYTGGISADYDALFVGYDNMVYKISTDPPLSPDMDYILTINSSGYVYADNYTWLNFTLDILSEALNASDMNYILLTLSDGAVVYHNIVTNASSIYTNPNNYYWIGDFDNGSYSYTVDNDTIEFHIRAKIGAGHVQSNIYGTHYLINQDFANDTGYISQYWLTFMGVYSGAGGPQFPGGANPNITLPIWQSPTYWTPPTGTPSYSFSNFSGIPTVYMNYLWNDWGRFFLIALPILLMLLGGKHFAGQMGILSAVVCEAVNISMGIEVYSTLVLGVIGFIAIMILAVEKR